MVQTHSLRTSQKQRYSNAKRSVATAAILLCLALSAHRVQGQALHVYSAWLVRAPGPNPMKPLLADLMDWLPDAEITIGREDDVLHIALQRTITPDELRTHLEPHAVQLASFLCEGEAPVQTNTTAKQLPWLVGTEPNELTQEEVAGRKEAWIRQNPAEYKALTQATNEFPGPK